MTASSDDVAEVPARTIEAIAPDAGLFADLDPLAMGRVLAQVSAGLLRHPLGAARAGGRAATGMLTSAALAASRALGQPVPARLAPAKGDNRFSDAAWEHNALYFALRQAYLQWNRLAEDLLDAAGLDERQRQKAAFSTQLVVDALAPTNFLATNPAALKQAFDTGGLSLARGLRNFLDDVVNNDGRPRQVDRSPFELGDNLAATPGKVVYRNELMELIQYAPQTETVHEVPIVCSPPWINKYYIMDLAPGRSFIEWMVQHGHTVFTISYRNPDASMRDVNMDDYLVDGTRAAVDVVRDITGRDQVNMVGLCLGGTLAVALLAYLDAVGDDLVHSLTLLNTLVDFSEPGPLGCFTDEATIARLEQKMNRRGYLEETQLRGTFDALRANDLIFNYLVNNWLMGKQPPAFDILAWNADSTRMPAKMHSYYLRSCYLHNQLARGEMELRGVRLNLETVRQDVFIVGAQNDHIAPWRSSYRTTQLLKSNVEYVLSSAGHIAGIVNPPSSKARYRASDANPPSPDEWLKTTTEYQRSWWEHWAEWAAERGGDRVDPPSMGSDRYPVLGDGPGEYVRG
ncbi:class I poly(R)-hydroxyalkanoic acid synthase [soil metagenome]